MNEESETFNSGFVSIIGLPNAGKSTLLNKLVNFPLAIISPKPQTTRRKIAGIMNGPGFQAVFLDTPGFLNPKTPFEKKMRSGIKEAVISDCDIICCLCEPGGGAIPADYLSMLKEGRKKVFLAVNKTDISTEKSVKETAAEWERVLEPDGIFKISALTGKGVAELKNRMIAALPFSPPFYPPDQVTPLWERFLVSEIIRETIFNLLAREIPYTAAVETDVFREKPPVYVHAVIHVSKESAKPIMLGKGGRKIRRIREISEKKISAVLGVAVKLDLSVKVTENWQRDRRFLKNLDTYGLCP